MADTKFDVVIILGRGRVATSPRSAPRNWASRPPWSSASISAESASTGVASRPRRCSEHPRSITFPARSWTVWFQRQGHQFRFQEGRSPGRARWPINCPRASNFCSRRTRSPSSTVMDSLAGKGKVAVEKGGKTGRDAGRQAHNSGDRCARSHAAGAGARRQAGLDLQGSDGARDSMPKSVLVVGSGAIGIEFASFYRTMGAEVTVVEVLDRVSAGRGRRDFRLCPKGVRKARHGDPHQGATVKSLKQVASPR